MFGHRLIENPSRKVVAHWFLMSFNAGAINAGGFLSTGRFVSHITGFATLFGVDLTNNRFHAAFGILSVPMFFLLGGFLAGLMIDRPILKGKKAHFDYAMGLSSLCLFAAAIAGQLSQFGVFGTNTPWDQTYILMALLCLACGIQNASITSSSGSTVRTTHLTGLTTDLGLGLSRLVTFDKLDPRFLKEDRANKLRMGTILSFVLGSAAGAWIFWKLGYLGFLIPAFIDAYIAWHGRRAKAIAHVLHY